MDVINYLLLVGIGRFPCAGIEKKNACQMRKRDTLIALALNFIHLFIYSLNF